MKKLIVLFIAIGLLGIYNLSAQGGVAISDDESSPHESAMLEVKSTDKGLLLPRMTEAQRNGISDPATGLIVYCTNCGDHGEVQVYNGTNWTNVIGGAASIYVPTVTNPTTGEIWMDRNLGASQVATSSTDAAAYGDLYQWGRAMEGHQVRTSGTTPTNATTAIPNDGNPWDGLFITEISNPNDWLTSPDNTLWQGVSGTNNPCPSGFRLPTDAEWEAERLSWSTNDAAGAFASPLKLSLAGTRWVYDGTLEMVGDVAQYWSSTTSGNNAKILHFFSPAAGVNDNDRGDGNSVRCIKD